MQVLKVLRGMEQAIMETALSWAPVLCYLQSTTDCMVYLSFSAPAKMPDCGVVAWLNLLCVRPHIRGGCTAESFTVLGSQRFPTAVLGTPRALMFLLGAGIHNCRARLGRSLPA